MRIVFFGSADFAVPSLKGLCGGGHDIIGVFTQPDKPKNRGYHLAAPPVKSAAADMGISVYQPATLKDGTALEILRELGPDIIVVVAYGKIIPSAILRLPRYGCVNLHGSLLPKYRGAAPIQWSVINGETITGVTTIFMDEGIDTGDIILKEETRIEPDETSGELGARLAVMGAGCLSKTLELIASGAAPRQKQDEPEACCAPILDKGMALMDFTKDSRSLYNLVRGMSPWPVAYTFIGGKRLKVYRAAVREGFNGKPGEVAGGGGFAVCCGEGALELLEVQLEGSKRMSAAEFLKGRRAGITLRMGPEGQ